LLVEVLPAQALDAHQLPLTKPAGQAKTLEPAPEARKQAPAETAPEAPVEP
jgi:hypothetical protein